MMIRQLRGTIVQTTVVNEAQAHMVVDVNGVGYLVHTSPLAAQSLTVGQQEVVVYTSLIVREDSMQLAGFLTPQERELFDILHSASGVGLKMALAILSQLVWTDVITAIASGNTKMLTQVKGVGNKLAQKLSIELKDKLKAWHPETSASSDLPPDIAPVLSSNPAVDDAQAVLLSLGYSQTEINQALTAMTKEPGVSIGSLDVEQLLQKTLHWLALGQNTSVK